MYRFICANGHSSHSCSRDQGAHGCATCEEFAYRVAGPCELMAEGVNACDCVRAADVDDVRYYLHARTGLAYTWADVTAAERSRAQVRRDRTVMAAFR